MTALRFGLLALGLALFAAPRPSAADDLGLGLDPYIEYDVGATFMRNQNVTRDNPDGLNGSVRSHTGFNVGGAIGTRFLEHFRAEVNVGYRENQIENIAIQPGESEGKGRLSMVHVLTNAYAEYDFEVGAIPWFGLGIGYGNVAVDGHNRPDTFQLDSDAHTFLWNVMGGVSVPFSEVTTFSLGYRYMQTEDFKLRARIAGIGSVKVQSEYDAHELLLGVRYSF
jgi:opacity protein-like surface antigen